MILRNGKKVVEVVAAIILEGNKILACSRPNYAEGQYWEFPGGKVDPGESPRQALVREIREELGADVQPADCFWRLEHDYGEKYVRVTFYLARLTDTSPRPSPKENQQMRFLTADELDSVPFLPADLPVSEALHFFLKDQQSDARKQ